MRMGGGEEDVVDSSLSSFELTVIFYEYSVFLSSTLLLLVCSL